MKSRSLRASFRLRTLLVAGNCLSDDGQSLPASEASPPEPKAAIDNTEQNVNNIPNAEN
jgi:hypothetical protein